MELDLCKVQVLVVDNTEQFDQNLCFSIKEKSASIESKGVSIDYLHSTANLGYFGGASFGLDTFMKSNPQPDFVIVSNVDIVFPDKNFIKYLTTRKYDDNVGVIAPCIRSNLSGNDLNPFLYSRPSYLTFFIKEIVLTHRVSSYFYNFFYYIKKYILYLRGKVFSLIRKEALETRLPLKRTSEEKRTIYASHGSFFVFRSLFFELGGNINYPSFLFCEEYFIAETITSLGLCIQYDPSLVLVHNEHSSMRIQTSHQKRKWLSQSFKCIRENFFLEK
jgi:GT2 family glycosyltransferase